MERQRNARFWITLHRETPPGMGPGGDFPGGDFLTFVKIKLKPGESISEYESKKHEEGWSSSSTSWEHVGEGVERSWSDCGTDCDGRLDRYGDDFCPLEDLQREVPYHCNDPKIRLPRWDAVSSRQRDYFAEAMGY